MALLSKDRDVEGARTRPGEPRSGDLSVVTKDVRIVGDIETSGRVRLEGTVTGSVRARSIELTATGSVEGDVTALAGDDDTETFAIDGTVHGAVRARHVEIGEGGSVLGGVEADHATVRGRIQGGIQARDRLALKASAVVEGDIDARRLSLEEGGQVNGNIRIGDRAALEETGRRGQGSPVTPQRGAEPSPAASGKPEAAAKETDVEEARASA
ncbi:MAG TPA: polymer-forming cytoskeletal protein [Longimicrobiales bacterium]|nr:polymer-forming cytoskeletal protein [Longimicrobiales bacterium]